MQGNTEIVQGVLRDRENINDIERLQKEAFIEAYCDVYEDVFFTDFRRGQIQCVQNWSVVPSPAQPGVRVSLEDALAYFHGLIYPQDREAFDQVMAEGGQAEKVRREPRVLRVRESTGENRYYAVRFISLAKDTGLLCCRDVTGQTRWEQKQISCASVEDVGRLLRSHICADADFTEFFDISTGRRIRSGVDLDPLALSDVETLQGFFRRLEVDIHPADRPQFIACAAYVLALDPGTATFWYVRHIWRIRMGERDGEPVWRWHETIFLYMPDEEPEGGVLYILSRDNNDNPHPHPELEDVANRFPEILSQHEMEAYCAVREAELRPGEETGQICLLEADTVRDLSLELQDEVILRLSEVLHEEASGSRIAARLHDGTFLLWCQDMADPDALRVYIQTVKARMEVPLSDGTRLAVSAGTAACINDGPGSYRRAIDRANVALRTAQRLGGGQIFAYWPEMENDSWVSTQEKYLRRNGFRHDVQIRTFGHFDLFVDGETVLFHSEKAKELLALLTDRRGGFLTAREAVSCLWENDPADNVTMARYRKVAMRLRRTLEEYDVADIVISENGRRRLDLTKVSCDLTAALANPTAFRVIRLPYMPMYSWAEVTNAELMARR